MSFDQAPEVLGPVRYGEERWFAFDFSSETENSIVSAVFEAGVKIGIDMSASGVISGDPIYDGPLVKQFFKNFKRGVTYLIKVTARDAIGQVLPRVIQVTCV